MMITKSNGCRNYNHGRRDPPVRACPMCGELVNAKIATKRCSSAEHADRRKAGDRFCVDCAGVLRV
jgi:hypothetical protein